MTNLYLLVEGRTEELIYQQWLSDLLPQLHRVHNPSDVTNDSYYIFNAAGNRGIISTRTHF
ncbi:hypothetical protein QUF58_04360 [Anaerolineales bacterium HSG24]|nr:hypothetical protein [Anaerolineales bacterium HSG24]